MYFAPLERIFREVDTLRRERRRGGGPPPTQADVANIAHLGWTSGERPVREFSVPDEIGAEAAVEAALEVWQPVHKGLLRGSDPSSTSREVWESALAEAISEIWLLHTAGRLHRIPETLLTYTSQVLLDDLREAIIRRRVAEAHVERKHGKREVITEGMAIVMVGYALVDGGRDKTGRDGAEAIADLLDAGFTPADGIADHAHPLARQDIARVEFAWKTLWPVGLPETRGWSANAGVDPTKNIDTRSEPRAETTPDIHALGLFGGVNGWQTSPAKMALASKLSHTTSGLRALYVMGAAEDRLTKPGKEAPALWESAGAGAVIRRLRASEATRRQTDDVLERYTKALGQWHGNLSRAQANPRWHPGEPVDLPGSLSRAELVAIMVYEYIRSDVPLGSVLETVNRLAEEGTITKEGRREIHAFAMASAARHLARPSIERDPLGRADDAADEKDKTHRQDLRDTLGGVEEAMLLERRRLPASSHKELWARAAADIDKRLDRVSGAYPVVGESDRDALGSAQKGGGSEEWNYAERVVLRRLSATELWALHAYFTIRGNDVEVPIEHCPASAMHAQLGVGERQAGELRRIAASTGESLSELRDRIRHACTLTNIPEPKMMGRLPDKKAPFPRGAPAAKPWSGGDSPKR